MQRHPWGAGRPAVPQEVPGARRAPRTSKKHKTSARRPKQPPNHPPSAPTLNKTRQKYSARCQQAGTMPRPLTRALQRVWVFRFVDPGPGVSVGPREAPLSYPWAHT